MSDDGCQLVGDSRHRAIAMVFENVTKVYKQIIEL